MWCLSVEETKQWRETFRLNNESRPADVAHEVIVPLTPLSWTRLTWFSRFVASSIGPFDECLLWITLHGVWGSSENWHLFYRLRESYGEHRRLGDAPGHLFLMHETNDLTTMVELALIFGWDFLLSGDTQYVNVFASHDEFVHFYSNRQGGLATLAKALTSAKVEFEERSIPPPERA